MTTNGSEVPPVICPLQLHVDSFFDHLHVNGYAPQSVTNKRSIVIAFAQWSQGERIGVDDLSEDHLAAFVKRRPPRPTSAVEMRTCANS